VVCAAAAVSVVFWNIIEIHSFIYKYFINLLHNKNLGKF
jgi:hypothetical protein